MSKTLKDFIADARAHIGAVSPADAEAASADGSALILDVREPEELQKVGSVAGALAIPRGMLEPRADDGPMSNDDLLDAKDEGQRVHVLCATGVRATLAAHTLKQMGYDAAVIEGGIKAWKDAGLPVEQS